MSKNKKELRLEFRNSCFKRDKYKCVKCGQKSSIENILNEMDCHHITDRNEMPNGGFVIENGITLCKKECHMKAERYHITDGKDWVEGYHPLDLYELIKSNLGLAKEKSKLL